MTYFGQNNMRGRACPVLDSLDPNSTSAYFNKGVSLAGLNQYEEAIAAFDQTIRLDPNYVGAYIRLYP
jgi:tetratricopeptide (TPR) repeat protein